MATRNRKPAPRTRLKLPLHLHFSGALAVVRDRKGQFHAHVLGSAAQAEAFGAAPALVRKMFPRRKLRAAMVGCATIASVKPNGLWIYCRDIDCVASGGEDCWLYSALPGGGGEEEHRGGAWFQPGRIYYCSCIFFA